MTEEAEKSLKLRKSMILVKVNRALFSPPAGFKAEFKPNPLKEVLEAHKQVTMEIGFFGQKPSDARPVAYIMHLKGKIEDEPAIFSVNFIIDPKGFVEYEIGPMEWDSLIDLGDFEETETLPELYERVVKKLKEEHKAVVSSVLGYGSYIELEFPPGSGIVIGVAEGEPETVGMGLMQWDNRFEPSEWGLS
ncbi:protein of unknown function (plasmid) [Thermococcus nautili]|uniref:hypothetical protein n=1 Tax=Thermococcus nautili TaxID=195522 RepID=UPI002556C519|nr:hypothetical protein [Thermococcus nautili]CAI1494154.1 protein of unknown function [Thermococcus nautili]